MMMMNPPNQAELLLIRHPQVDTRYRGVCYGRSDVALSPGGRQQSRSLARQLAHLPVKRIVHSGLQRTSFLAAALGRLTGIAPEQDVALVERDFGSWELRTWDEIYQCHGNEMLKMVTEPEEYRPGGGETTDEMTARVWGWFQRRSGRGLTVAVTHGGPIAACLGRQRQLPVAQWAELIPACGSLVWSDPFRTPMGSGA